MLEEYLKRLESLITPRSFSLTGFKDQSNIAKGFKTSVDFKEEKETNNNQNTNNNNIKEKNDTSKANITETDMSPDIMKKEVHELRLKNHELKLNNMYYRHDIHLLKQQIDTQKKDIKEKDELIKKLDNQIKDNNKYLLRLEGVRAKEGVLLDPQSNNVATSSNNLNNNPNSNPKSNDDIKKSSKKEGGWTLNNANPSNLNQSNLRENVGNLANDSHLNISNLSDMNNLKGLNLSDKKAVKEFALKVMAENKKLKGFQAKIYEVSKTYDVLNEKITNGLRSVKKFFEDVSTMNSIDGAMLSNLSSKLKLIHR
jgi:hypothetical protein